MATQRTCWAVIPAAGSGTRMGQSVPKQYLPLAGSTVIEHTLQPFLDLDVVHGVVVVLSGDDTRWHKLAVSKHPKIHTVTGGAERFHSVLNGLRYLTGIAGPEDIVLVHDAARPCIRKTDILRVIESAEQCRDGAILAVPARDTMKRSDKHGHISVTVSRDDLWHALTPQVFRLAILRNALEQAISDGINVTDDAQAVELAGGRPVLVEGQADNIKITRSADLLVAELLLKQREETL